MTRTSARLGRHVLAAYGDDADGVIAGLGRCPFPERVQAAAVLGSDGTPAGVQTLLRLADVDWRDTLMSTHRSPVDLASDGWELRLDGVLGPGRPVVLWRPTGPEELTLVEESGWTAWPPRLPDQPIFYPVLNEEYAVKIARDWNVPRSGSGHVTRFEVEAEFIERYPVQQAGGRTILEYWIPAEDLDELNDNLIGRIELVASFPG